MSCKPRMLLAILLPAAICVAEAREGIPGSARGVGGISPFCGFVETGGSFTALQGLCFFGGQPNGINASEQIADPFLGVVDAQKGAIAPIVVPGAKITAAFGINDTGTVVGYYFNGSVDPGFQDKAGVFTTIAFPGASWTVAYGINSAGVVVGYYVSAAKARDWHIKKASSPQSTFSAHTIPWPPGSTTRAISWAYTLTVHPSTGFWLEPAPTPGLMPLRVLERTSTVLQMTDLSWTVLLIDGAASADSSTRTARSQPSRFQARFRPTCKASTGRGKLWARHESRTLSALAVATTPLVASSQRIPL